MSHDRKTSIGGSIVSTILGRNRYVTREELFHYMLGVDDESADNVTMFLGRETEEIAAKIFEKVTGVKSIVAKRDREHPYFRFGKYPLTGSFDRVYNRNNNRGILEIKSCYLNEWARVMSEGPSFEAYTQLQTYLMWPGYDEGTIMYWNVESAGRAREWENLVGRGVIIRRYKPNRKFQKFCRQEIQKFCEALEAGELPENKLPSFEETQEYYEKGTSLTEETIPAPADIANLIAGIELDRMAINTLNEQTQRINNDLNAKLRRLESFAYQYTLPRLNIESETHICEVVLKAPRKSYAGKDAVAFISANHGEDKAKQFIKYSDPSISIKAKRKGLES